MSQPPKTKLIPFRYFRSNRANASGTEKDTLVLRLRRVRAQISRLKRRRIILLSTGAVLLAILIIKVR